jgi:hypothetical protein
MAVFTAQRTVRRLRSAVVWVCVTACFRASHLTRKCFAYQVLTGYYCSVRGAINGQRLRALRCLCPIVARNNENGLSATEVILLCMSGWPNG